MVKDVNGVEDGNIEELESTPEGTSPEETGSGASSSGDGKHVTPEGQEKSGYVPKARFDEVYAKAKRAEELEEALAEHQDKFTRDPITGKLKLRFEEKPKAQPQSDDDELSDEDQLVFDEQQQRVIQKLLNKQQRQIFTAYERAQTDSRERAKHWDAATKKFPDLLKEDSELRKEAEKIAREEFAQPIKNSRGEVTGIYLPPKANLDAAEKAYWRLRERAEEADRAKKEANKMKNQNTFVNRSSKVVPEKGNKSDDDFENLSPDEQSAVLEKEHREQMENQETE